MSKEFGDVEAKRVCDLYNIGTSRHWRNNDGLSTTFPQINEKGKLCQLKVMAYNPNTGKRMKKQDRAEMWSDKAQKYIPDTLKGHKIRWNLEYKTAELKVDILCNCEIEGIK